MLIDCILANQITELWLDWIRDEMKVAFSDEEKQAVMDLFERAVKDYICG